MQFARGSTSPFSAGDTLHDQWQQRSGPLDEHKPYLNRRLAEGCGKAAALRNEIKAR